ncbi:MAG TPA: hypothetical protein PLY88_07280 [Candidatus Omnitrophota bacterium]|nr:hypothetical protein [Candidatus Omnitrophota bacterium]
MKKTNKQKFVVAALAGLMAVAGSIVTQGTAQAEDVQCYGVNKCKGTGDCGGKGSACHGSNACKGQGWKTMDKAACLAIEGGSLAPKE